VLAFCFLTRLIFYPENGGFHNYRGDNLKSYNWGIVGINDIGLTLKERRCERMCWIQHRIVPSEDLEHFRKYKIMSTMQSIYFLLRFQLLNFQWFSLDMRILQTSVTSESDSSTAEFVQTLSPWNQSLTSLNYSCPVYSSVCRQVSHSAGSIFHFLRLSGPSLLSRIISILLNLHITFIYVVENNFRQRSPYYCRWAVNLIFHLLETDGVSSLLFVVIIRS
jgi:hypothetical protein